MAAVFDPNTRKHWRRRLLISSVALLALAGGLYWVNGATVSRGETVLSEEVTRGAIEDLVTGTGKIQPRAYVDVGAQASGQLNRILVHIGDDVKQGQLLVEIDPQVQAAKVDADEAQLAQYNAKLLEQQANIEYAEATLKRYMHLAAGAISQMTFDDSRRDAKTATAKADAIRAEIKQMESTLKGDRISLGYTKIYAPMSGTVVSIDAREGQTLNATYSTPVVMRIADLSTMTIWSQVSEADVTRLREGMDIWFTTLGHGDKRWAAKLRQILPAPQKPDKPSGQSDANSTSSGSTNPVVLYTALFDVDNRTGELRPEMTAQVSFVVARRENAIITPMSALRFKPLRSGHSHVDVLTADGRRIDRGITVGLRTRFEAQVLSGLEPGERVVTGARRDKDKKSLVGFRL